MSWTKTTKPTNSFTNDSKPSSSFVNGYKSFGYGLWSTSSSVWQLSYPWMFVFNTYTNESK